jgi:hypothetical protein
MALRAALCVGIDDYASPYELSGCARDAKAWAAALADLGFEVTTLTNHRATRAAILDGLAGLVGRAATGDSIVFQFAGHGTQVDDLDGDERDGKDEALCPFDWGKGALIIDDDLRAVLAQLPRGATCSCFIDCCHSGTITRLVRRAPGTKVVARRPRFLPESAALNRVFARARGEAGAVTPAAAPDEGDGPEILFAACQAEEVAHETDEGGDFTTRAVPLLARGAKGWTNQQFVDAVVEAFGPRPLQRPRLDCAPAAARKKLLGL